LNPSYWKPRFLYPYALDPEPIRLNDAKQTNKEIYEEKKRQKMLGDQSILHTNKYEFPERMIQEEDDKIEIRKPIQMTYDDIQMDMYDYAKDFP
jgi:hypothetical protein